MRFFGGIVPFILAIVTCLGAYQLEIGQFNKPGPGLWPLVLGIALLICSVLHIIIEAHQQNYEKFTRQSRQVLLSVAAIAAFVVIFNTLGLLPSVIVLMVFQLRYVGRETWKPTLTTTVLATAVVYVLFSVWLKIPFPGLLS